MVLLIRSLRVLMYLFGIAGIWLYKSAEPFSQQRKAGIALVVVMFILGFTSILLMARQRLINRPRRESVLSRRARERRERDPSAGASPDDKDDDAKA